MQLWSWISTPLIFGCISSVPISWQSGWDSAFSGVNTNLSVVEVEGTFSSPLLVAIVVAAVEAVVTVALPSPDDGGLKVADNLAADVDAARLRGAPKNPLVVGVALRRESIVMDMVDIAEPGRGLGLGLGGAPSESVVSAEEYALASGTATGFSSVSDPSREFEGCVSPRLRREKEREAEFVLECDLDLDLSEVELVKSGTGIGLASSSNLNSFFIVPILVPFFDEKILRIFGFLPLSSTFFLALMPTQPTSCFIASRSETPRRGAVRWIVLVRGKVAWGEIE
jgi:hypothetical protein